MKTRAPHPDATGSACLKGRDEKGALLPRRGIRCGRRAHRLHESAKKENFDWMGQRGGERENGMHNAHSEKKKGAALVALERQEKPPGRERRVTSKAVEVADAPYVRRKNHSGGGETGAARS